MRRAGESEAHEGDLVVTLREKPVHASTGTLEVATNTKSFENDFFACLSSSSLLHGSNKF
jgi:hypothetical protein